MPGSVSDLGLSFHQIFYKFSRVYSGQICVKMEKCFGKAQDKARFIFKTGNITITLYDKPKKDPRSKLHIQSADQKKNLEFIMDKLALFYKEVCITQDNPSSVMKSKNRAMCPKYGKLFTNKKGVKQHILRMHVQKAKLNESKTETITLEESPDIIPHPPTSVTRTQPMDVVTVQTVPKEVNNQILERENEGVENSKEADKEFIRLIANEIVDECNLEDYNFQCGECGQIFAEEKETEMHVSNHHCSLCDKFEKENKMLKLESVNKEKVNAS